MTEKVNHVARELNDGIVGYDYASCWKLAVEVAGMQDIVSRLQDSVARGLMNVLHKVSIPFLRRIPGHLSAPTT
jgi:hypothetical protein